MKKLILLSVLFIAFIAAKAQDPIFVKGDKVINLGIGYGWYINLSASGEYCVLDGIADKGSVGVGLYGGLGFSHSLTYSHSNSFFGGARGTFHYPLLDKLDTYAGLGLGLNYRYYKYYSDEIYVDFNPFIGARYPLMDKLTVFGEIGYGFMGNLVLGVSFKL